MGRSIIFKHKKACWVQPGLTGMHYFCNKVAQEGPW